MQDQGEVAERQRRLAIAGLMAALVFVEPSNNEQQSELAKVLLDTSNYLRSLYDKKEFWPHGSPPEIETYTQFEIDKDGKVINYSGKRVY